MVFESPYRLNGLVAELEELIHPKQDDIRIYPIPPKPEAVKMGVQRFDGYLLYHGMESLHEWFEYRKTVGEEAIEGGEA